MAPSKKKRDDVDQASLDSFPASDPPAWTNTIAAPHMDDTPKKKNKKTAKKPTDQSQ